MYDALKLENQLCFPLYVCSKEIVKQYKPHLDKLGLTYTQYITMMVLWEYGKINVRELGQHLFLDSGTLTPVLKKLEQKGWISRERDRQDERNLIITLTGEGEQMKEEALEIPGKIGQCIPLTQEEMRQLYGLLYKMKQTFISE